MLRSTACSTRATLTLSSMFSTWYDTSLSGTKDGRAGRVNREDGVLGVMLKRQDGRVGRFKTGVLVWEA